MCSPKELHARIPSNRSFWVYFGFKGDLSCLLPRPPVRQGYGELRCFLVCWRPGDLRALRQRRRRKAKKKEPPHKGAQNLSPCPPRLEPGRVSFWGRWERKNWWQKLHMVWALKTPCWEAALEASRWPEGRPRQGHHIAERVGWFCLRNVKGFQFACAGCLLPVLGPEASEVGSASTTFVLMPLQLVGCFAVSRGGKSCHLFQGGGCLWSRALDTVRIWVDSFIPWCRLEPKAGCEVETSKPSGLELEREVFDQERRRYEKCWRKRKCHGDAGRLLVDGFYPGNPLQ